MLDICEDKLSTFRIYIYTSIYPNGTTVPVPDHTREISTLNPRVRSIRTALTNVQTDRQTDRRTLNAPQVSRENKRPRSTEPVRVKSGQSVF